ncbi:hypothetical protein AAMO2058_000407000 [Amorphochlora amoebiformis]
MPVLALQSGRVAVGTWVEGCTRVSHLHYHFKVQAMGRFEVVTEEELLHRRTQMRYWRAYGCGIVQKARVLKYKRDLREVARLAKEKLGIDKNVVVILITGEAEAKTAFWTIESRKFKTKFMGDRKSKGSVLYVTNHFPGIRAIVDKGAMDEQIDALRSEFSEEYSFYPQGWNLGIKSNLENFQQTLTQAISDFKSKGSLKGLLAPTYILKPHAGSCGGGIRLVQKWEEVERALVEGRREERKRPLARMRGYGALVAQTYLSNPALIGGYKFDCRVYVMLRSINPIEVYVLHQGMGRVCVEKYHPPSPSNLDQTLIHLTNYALNKVSDKFKHSNTQAPDARAAKDSKEEKDQQEGLDSNGNKRFISILIAQLQREGMKITESTFWDRVDNMVAKTLLALKPRLVDSLLLQKSTISSHNNLPTPPHILQMDQSGISKNPYTRKTLDPNYPNTLWIAGAGSDAVDGEYWQNGKRGGWAKYEKVHICRQCGKKEEIDLYSVTVGKNANDPPPTKGWTVLKGGYSPPPRVHTDVDKLLRSLYKIPKKHHPNPNPNHDSRSSRPPSDISIQNEKKGEKDTRKEENDMSGEREKGGGGERMYQLLGFDFLLDQEGGTHLLEVNANPSMMTHKQPFDKRLKTGVLHTVMQILDPETQRRTNFKFKFKPQPKPNPPSYPTPSSGSREFDFPTLGDKACKDVLDIPYVVLSPEKMFPKIAKSIATRVKSCVSIAAGENSRESLSK